MPAYCSGSRAPVEDLEQDVDRFPAQLAAGVDGGGPQRQFGEGVLEPHDLQISDTRIRVPGYAHPIELDTDDPYPDMASN